MEMEGRIMYTLPKIKHKLILKEIKEICFLFLQFINTRQTPTGKPALIISLYHKSPYLPHYGKTPLSGISNDIITLCVVAPRGICRLLLKGDSLMTSWLHMGIPRLCHHFMCSPAMVLAMLYDGSGCYCMILEGKFHCLAKANAKINLNYQMLL